MRFNATGDSSTRSLLATIFAELVIPGREFVWTASLLYPLTRLGITEHAARRGIGRIAANGWIENDKVGREVRWRLTDSGVRLIDEITRRASSLQHQPERWDGRCVVLSITVPRDKKNVRRPLYTALGWAGFGNPMPGLWASPHVDRLAEARSVIHELGLRDSAVCLVGTTARVGLSDPDIVQRAWDLKDIGDRYRTLLETFEGLQPEPGDDSLLAYLTLVNEWRKFPYIDPQLPQDLLPDWIGRRAVAAFAELHRRWRPEAITRWAEILRETRPRDE
jgi:phenylacetic acid degradation operon negative regulatory protein